MCPHIASSTLTPTSPAHWKNVRKSCRHRSSLAGPPQAALQLERRDPHSSVPFVHLACSGAKIVKGIFKPYDAAEDDEHRPPAQIDSLRKLSQMRPMTRSRFRSA